MLRFPDLLVLTELDNDKSDLNDFGKEVARYFLGNFKDEEIANKLNDVSIKIVNDINKSIGTRDNDFISRIKKLITKDYDNLDEKFNLINQFFKETLDHQEKNRDVLLTQFEQDYGIVIENTEKNNLLLREVIKLIEDNSNSINEIYQQNETIFNDLKKIINKKIVIPIVALILLALSFSIWNFFDSNLPEKKQMLIAELNNPNRNKVETLISTQYADVLLDNETIDKLDIKIPQKKCSSSETKDCNKAESEMFDISKVNECLFPASNECVEKISERKDNLSIGQDKKDSASICAYGRLLANKWINFKEELKLTPNENLAILSGKFENLAKFFHKTAILIAPEDHRILFCYAIFSKNLDDTKLAGIYFEHAEKLSPKKELKTILTHLEEHYIQTGKTEKALEKRLEIIELETEEGETNIDDHLRHANRLFELQDFENASFHLINYFREVDSKIFEKYKHIQNFSTTTPVSKTGKNKIISSTIPKKVWYYGNGHTFSIKDKKYMEMISYEDLEEELLNIPSSMLKTHNVNKNENEDEEYCLSFTRNGIHRDSLRKSKNTNIHYPIPWSEGFIDRKNIFLLYGNNFKMYSRGGFICLNEDQLPRHKGGSITIAQLINVFDHVYNENFIAFTKTIRMNVTRYFFPPNFEKFSIKLGVWYGDSTFSIYVKNDELKKYIARVNSVYSKPTEPFDKKRYVNEFKPILVDTVKKYIEYKGIKINERSISYPEKLEFPYDDSCQIIYYPGGFLEQQTRDSIWWSPKKEDTGNSFYSICAIKHYSLSEEQYTAFGDRLPEIIKVEKISVVENKK